MTWRTFFELCEAAGHVVPLADTARAAGLDPGTVRRRAAAEGWWRPYPDVVAPPAVRVDARVRALAATLHLRRRTDQGAGLVAATRWTAAHLYDVRRSAPTRSQILIRAERHPRDHRGIEVVRARRLLPTEVTVVDHLPIVGPVRLLRDLAPVCDRDALRTVAIDLTQKGLLTLADVVRAMTCWPTFPGRARLRRVLADLGVAGRTDSPLEYGARQDLEAAGIPLDRGQVAVPLVGGGLLHVDLGIAAVCFGIEVDSLAHHTSREDLTRDARRHNAIAEVGDDWRVLRLTWDIRRHDWARFVAQVREVVAAQARRHLGVPWPRPGDLRPA